MTFDIGLRNYLRAVVAGMFFGCLAVGITVGVCAAYLIERFG